MKRRFIFVEEVQAALAGGQTEMALPEGTRFSPAANDLIREKGIRVLLTEPPAPENKKALEPTGDKNKKMQDAAQTSTFIAVVSAGRDTAGTVGNIAARSPYFLLFNNRGELIEVIENPHKNIGGGAGPLVAELMAEKGVKTVIAGNFGINIKASFEEKGVGYLAFSGTVDEAVKCIVGRQ